jgi:hypothetical protein
MYPPSWYLPFAMLNLDRLPWKIPVLHHGAQALLGTRFVPGGAQLVLLFFGLGERRHRTWPRHIPLFVFLTFPGGLVF